MNSYPFKWSKLQSAEDIDVGRFFEYDQDAMEMFTRWLPSIEKEGSALEVGAGSGFFTEKLHQIYPDVDISCLEPDAHLRACLHNKFPEIDIIPAPLQSLEGKNDDFDLVISHIVIHNLPNPLEALGKMKNVITNGGHMVCIEPALGSRHYVPDQAVNEAFDTIFRYKMVMSRRRSESLGSADRDNPFYRNYAHLFERLNLTDIRCHGWCSVFTLSDSRFTYEERKQWIHRRNELYESQRETVTGTLLEAGLEESEIEGAYSTLFNYFSILKSANEEELSHIHEQEIVARTITIGRKNGNT